MIFPCCIACARLGTNEAALAAAAKPALLLIHERRVICAIFKRSFRSSPPRVQLGHWPHKPFEHKMVSAVQQMGTLACSRRISSQFDFKENIQVIWQPGS